LETAAVFYPKPTASAGGNQTICSNGTATISGATSSNGTISWAENGEGSITSNGNTLAPTYTAAAGDAGKDVTLTMTVSNGTCTPATAIYTVHVNAVTAAPTGSEAQSFCTGNNPTVGNLSAIGNAIQWYADAVGGAPLASSTALVNGTHYYASQTVSGCESTSRLNVTATVSDPSAPTGSASQLFCESRDPAVGNLLATGNAIKWYDAAIGGDPLEASTALVNGTHYYATQTVDGCESISRLDVLVTLSSCQVFVTPGTSTFVVPANVTEITVQVWGRGGYGGSCNISAYAGGGGGGAYSSRLVPFHPGTA